ncbi:hypothetical protein Tco_0818776, partial [Tanacetum coccineum]
MAANQALEYALQCGDLTVKSVLYQNFLREFWCTAIAYDPTPPADDSKERPLKEYKIKFTMMNGKNSLTLYFKTFIKATGLDYNQGTYVSHPSPEVVKAEFAKIATDEVLINMTHVLKTAFPVAWRIIFTFMIQVHIGEIICSDLVTRLINKSRQKYVSYPRFVSCALEVLLGAEYTQDEKFGSLPKVLTTETPPTEEVPTEDSDKTQLVSLGQTAYPQDTERNIQLGVKGFHSSPNEGTRKSQPFFEGKTTNPKDSEGTKHPADKGLPSMVPDESMGKTKPLPRGP